jgi:hypothetical protein
MDIKNQKCLNPLCMNKHEWDKSASSIEDALCGSCLIELKSIQLSSSISYKKLIDGLNEVFRSQKKLLNK